MYYTLSFGIRFSFPAMSSVCDRKVSITSESSKDRYEVDDSTMFVTLVLTSVTRGALKLYASDCL